MRVEQIGDATLYCGDCLEIMPTLDKVDAVVTDPPYFDVVNEKWDRKWDTVEEFADYICEVFTAIKPNVASNGSILLFGDDANIAYVQVRLDKILTYLNNIVWYKTNNQSIKAAPNLRSYAPMTERLLFYTPELCRTGLETLKIDINNFIPLRDYFRDYSKAIGVTKKTLIERIGQKVDHCFRYNSTQWDMPTRETYEQINAEFPVAGFLRREYEDLRREYEDLRRPFNASEKTLDVITGPIVTVTDNTEHPTTKPLWLMRKLIMDITRQPATILDPFMGSGTTGVAAVQEGRKFIGIEIDEKYFDIACKRIEEAQRQFRLF